MTDDAVLFLIKKRVDREGLRETARRLAISSSYLSDVIHGNRPVGPKILAALGLERVTVIRKVANAS